MSEHPTNGLDDAVHQRVRLGVLAVTEEARRVEFTFLRERRSTRTWIHLTKAGRQALDDEVAALKALIRQLEGPTAAAGAEEDAGPGPAAPAPRWSSRLSGSP
ncbi:hypothetical protein ACWDRR_39440 [Kitasatospora sp. NPDC003701]